MSNGCKHGYLPPCTFCADERIRSEHAAMRAELSRMRTALETAQRLARYGEWWLNLERELAKVHMTVEIMADTCGISIDALHAPAIAERALAPEGRALTAGSKELTLIEEIDQWVLINGPQGATDLLNRCRADLVRSPAENEFAWVIEGGPEPLYWDGRAIDSWSSKNTDAVRFARFEDAERVRCWLLQGIGGKLAKSVQHGWSALTAGSGNE